MVVVKNPQNYKFIKFVKSKTKYKKYDVILKNKKNNKIKTIPFGDKRYQQYKDSTGLKLYSKLDHNDKNRRRLFRLRHAKTSKKKFSSSWFSYRFLW
jgi:hypothetical protein